MNTSFSDVTYSMWGETHSGQLPLSFGGLTDHSRKKRHKNACWTQPKRSCECNELLVILNAAYMHIYDIIVRLPALDFPPFSPCLSPSLRSCRRRSVRHVTGRSQGPAGPSQPTRSLPHFFFFLSESSRVTQRKQYQDSQLSTHNLLAFWCDDLTWRSAAYDNAERWNTARAPHSRRPESHHRIRL